MTMKQKGFTLLELLVVVTILAILAAGALVAYDGIGESSKSAADSNNIATIDQAVRTYKVVESALPNQWDSLLTDTQATLPAGFLDTGLANMLTHWNHNNTSSVGSSVADAFIKSGFNEIQTILSTTTLSQAQNVTGGINSAHTEINGVATEIDVDNSVEYMVVKARRGSAGTVDCTAGGANIAGGATDNNILGRINDSFLEGNKCHLVIALGFGNDAAQSTTDSPAAIQAAAVSGSVNKNTYGRYIALFHMAESDTGSAVIDQFHTTPHFIGVLAPNGKTLNEVISLAKGGN